MRVRPGSGRWNAAEPTVSPERARCCVHVRIHAVLGSNITEQPHHVDDVLRELIDVDRVHVSTQRNHRVAVGARGTPDAQVDASRVQGFEHGELFGDDERSVIGQHDTA